MNELLHRSLPIGSAIGIYVARLIELSTKRDTVKGEIRETLTLRLFMLTGTTMLVCAIAEFCLIGHFVLWMFLFGWLLAVLSIWIRHQAIRALGKFWSLHVEIRENHQLVVSGPFRWLRHPVYLSTGMELLAIGFILDAWVTLAIIPWVFIPVLLMRIRLEEAALIEKFGEAYREYSRRTPAVLPIYWPAPNEKH